MKKRSFDEIRNSALWFLNHSLQKYVEAKENGRISYIEAKQDECFQDVLFAHGLGLISDEEKSIYFNKLDMQYLNEREA